MSRRHDFVPPTPRSSQTTDTTQFEPGEEVIFEEVCTELEMLRQEDAALFGKKKAIALKGMKARTRWLIVGGGSGSYSRAGLSANQIALVLHLVLRSAWRHNAGDVLARANGISNPDRAAVAAALNATPINPIKKRLLEVAARHGRLEAELAKYPPPQ